MISNHRSSESETKRVTHAVN